MGINISPIKYFKMKLPNVILKINNTRGAYHGLIKNGNTIVDNMESQEPNVVM